MRLSKRIVSLVLSIFMIVGLWSSSTALVEAKEIDLAETATQNRTAYYNTNYTLTGNQVEDLIAVAEAQLGKTKANLGYTEAWCANFVSDCADLAGLSNIIPRSGGVRYLRENILNAGGYEVSQPQRGDIICYYCNTCLGIDGKPWAHVGIMLDSTYSIEGNRGGQVKKASGAFYDEYNHSNITKKYVRPAYTNSQVTPTDWDNPDSYPFPTRDIYYLSSNTMTGSDVKWVQAVLRKLGYSIDIDGSFGPASAAVVKQFQSDSGLEVDGSVGPITRQTLYDLWQRIKNPYIDVGTNFCALIINTNCWKPIENKNSNVELSTETHTASQVWCFYRNDDLSYNILSCLDNRAIDLANYGTSDGTNIQVVDNSNNDAQRWFLKENNGSYSLVPKCATNGAMDLNGNNSADGTNIHLWTYHGEAAQQFTIYKIDSLYDYITTDFGTDFYATISNTYSGLKLCNDHSNVSAKSSESNLNQIWRLERQYDKSYAIISADDDMCLDAAGAGTSDGTNIQTFTNNGTDAQRWYFLKYGDNKYKIMTKLGNSFVDVNGGSTVSGTNIQLWQPNQTNAQFFTIDKYSAPEKVNCKVIVNDSNVQVKWDSVAGALRYDVYLIQEPYGWEDVKYSKQLAANSLSTDFNDVIEGSYYAFVVSKPNLNSDQSTWVGLEVTKNNPTESPSDPATEIPTVTPTEEHTEPPTEVPTEAPTVAPTVQPTDAPTEPPTEVPTEVPTEPDTEPSTEPADDIDTGTTGDCNWSFNKTTGHLRIYGNGNMGDYTTRSSVPWYQYRTDIKTVAVEEGVEYIGGMAFMSCSNIESVTLAESVTHVGRRAFMSCSSLSEISPMTQIKVIDERAFLYCSELKDIALSDNIDYIGDSAFSYTGWSENHPDGPAYFGKILYKYFGLCPDEVEIKEGTKSISEYAFINRITLKRIKLPNTLTVISKRAFIGCSSLETIDIPDSVTSIEEFAFRGCSSLKSVTIPSSVTSIGNNVFENTAEDLTIYGYKDSVAETYANDNEIAFIDINNPPTEPTTEYILGDADGDGVVTILDATVIQRYLAAYTVKNPDTVVKCGDIAGDGLGIIDATLIQRYLAEFTVPYDIGQPTHQ